jgi:3-dehydroquinate synthase
LGVTSRNFKTQRTTATDYVVGEEETILRRVQGFCLSSTAAIIDAGANAAQNERVTRLLSAAGCKDAMVLEGGEKCKTLAQLTSVLQFLASIRLPKHGYVLAIGGGAVIDVAAMAASLMRRGTPLILVPTTLLAQIDAAIGGKNGINFEKEKNLLGGFHHADIVLCNPELLDTLGRREIICGLAEAIKVLVTSDALAFERHFKGTVAPTDLFSLVRDCISSKLNLLQEDPFETSSRRVLNYGHAFAHLLEEESDYALSHGEAVLLGMLIENEIGRAATAPDILRLDELQRIIGSYLTSACSRYWIGFDQIKPKLSNVRQMRRGLLNLVCIQRPGASIIVDDVADDVLQAAWLRTEQCVLRNPCRETAAPIPIGSTICPRGALVNGFGIEAAIIGGPPLSWDPSAA